MATDKIEEIREQIAKGDVLFDVTEVECLLSEIDRLKGGGVEAALAELREICPGSACSIEHVHRSGFGTPTPDEVHQSEVYESRYTVWVNSMVRGEATTLKEAMIQVREWSKQS